MRKYLAALVAAAAATAASGQSRATPNSGGREPVAHVNGWPIFDNQGDCATISDFDGGLTVDIAYYSDRNRAILTLTNPAWASVRQGEHYNVTINFNDGANYTPTAQGMVIQGPGGMTGVFMYFNGTQFLADFATSTSMRVEMNGIRLAQIGLRGTREVAEELVRCGTRSAIAHPMDPFAAVPPASAPRD